MNSNRLVALGMASELAAEVEDQSSAGVARPQRLVALGMPSLVATYVGYAISGMLSSHLSLVSLGVPPELALELSIASGSPSGAVTAVFGAESITIEALGEMTTPAVVFGAESIIINSL